MVNLADSKQHAETVARLSRQLRARIEVAKRRPQGLRQIIFQNRRRVP